MAKKKKRGGIRNIVRNVASNVKDKAKDFVHSLPKTKGLVKNAIKGVKNGIEDAALIPLVKPMKAALKAKGVTIFPRDRSKLAQLFIDKVVRGSQNFEDFDREKGKPFIIQPMKHGFENAEEGEEGASIADVAKDVSGIASIVKIVVDFFKNLKAKKDKGEPLNPLEEKLAQASEHIDQSIESATGQSLIGASRSGMDFNKILLYVGIALAAFIGLKALKVF
jgi:hypothetical protein